MTRDPECIFCKIVAGEFGTTFVYESDHVVAFNDIEPAAPDHVLIVPREHVSSAAGLGSANAMILGEILDAANTIAADRGLTERGYRIVTNVGPDAGQTVFHVHIHLLGGEPLGPMVATSTN